MSAAILFLLFLGLSKGKYFDLFTCSELCRQFTTESYSKFWKIIFNKIGKRININIVINCATTRNNVLYFDPEHNEKFLYKRTVSSLLFFLQ